MIQIQIIGLTRNQTGYIELAYKMCFLLPVIYGTGATPVKGLVAILSSFTDADKFSSEIIPVTGTVITLTEIRPLSNSSITLAQIKTQLQNRYTQVRTKLDSLTLSPYDTISGLSWDGTTWS